MNYLLFSLIFFACSSICSFEKITRLLSPRSQSAREDSQESPDAQNTIRKDLYITSVEGGTLLHGLAQVGNIDGMKTYLTVYKDINAQDKAGRTALHPALIHNQQAAVELLLNYTANVTLQAYEGIAPLGVAPDNEELIDRILETNDVDFSVTTRNQETLLHLAAKRGNKALCKVLIKKLIDGYALDNDGQTAAVVA